MKPLYYRRLSVAMVTLADGRAPNAHISILLMLSLPVAFCLVSLLKLAPHQYHPVEKPLPRRRRSAATVMLVAGRAQNALFPTPPILPLLLAPLQHHPTESHAVGNKVLQLRHRVNRVDLFREGHARLARTVLRMETLSSAVSVALHAHQALSHRDSTSPRPH